MLAGSWHLSSRPDLLFFHLNRVGRHGEASKSIWACKKTSVVRTRFAMEEMVNLVNRLSVRNLIHLALHTLSHRRVTHCEVQEVHGGDEGYLIARLIP